METHIETNPLLLPKQAWPVAQVGDCKSRKPNLDSSSDGATALYVAAIYSHVYGKIMI